MKPNEISAREAANLIEAIREGRMSIAVDDGRTDGCTTMLTGEEGVKAWGPGPTAEELAADKDYPRRRYNAVRWLRRRFPYSVFK